MKSFDECRLSRRAFLGFSASLAAGTLGGIAFAQSREEESEKLPPEFTPGHIRYTGGRWEEYATAMASFLDEIRLRTSIRAARAARPVDLSDPGLFEHPFLYLSGRFEFEMPTEAEIVRLRRHLSFGGFLLVDDGLGIRDEGFGRSARELIAKLFPRQSLEPLASDHSAYRSYYLIRSIGGRQAVSQVLEGVQLDDFTPVIYCQNDLGGAWARAEDGSFLEECTPGGEPQRTASFHLGVNIALFALTGNYKRDLIHHPFIQRRMNQG